MTEQGSIMSTSSTAGTGGFAGQPVPVQPVDPSRAMVSVATYPEYADAQRAVDFLSDNKFPVEHAAIVGTNLRMVEQVLGRMTTGKATLYGIGAGAWFGLFIGLLFAIFVPRAWFAMILTALVIGAIWGAIFGAIAHAMTRGKRDFTAARSLQAGEYGISVTAEYAEQARQLLARLNTLPTTA
jgi:hypothetical protein